MKEQKNIDEIFKEAFDQFEVDPGVDVWAKVQSGISSSAAASSAGAAGSASSSWVATAIVGLAISAAAVGGYYFFNQKGEAKVEAAIQASKKGTENNQPINTAPTNQSANDAADVSPENVGNTPANDKNGATIRQATPEQNTGKKLPKDQADPVRQLSNSSKSNTNTNKPEGEVIDQSQAEANENTTNPSSTEGATSAENDAPIEDDSNTSVQSTYQSAENSTSEKSDESSPSKIAEPASMDDEEKIAVHIEFPTTFTPDHDGINDKFIITKDFSVGLDKVQEASMRISNNTGKTVAVWKGVNGSWDGRLPDGSNAPKGNYLYQFIYTIDGKAQTPLNGLIFLNR
ncbi:MAG: gliding motility-associated C-terminal domain-containing protein [Vicingaceae bacterium]